MMKKIIDWLGYVPPLGVDKDTLGGQLYIHRCKHGLRQKDISDELQIDRWAVTKIENNIEVDDYYTNKISEYLALQKPLI